MKISRNDILLIAAVAMATWLIRGCFTPTKVNEKMIRNEEKIKYLEKERVEDSIVWVKREAAIDSLLALSVIRYDQLENRKQPIRYVIQNTPTVISNYDREQLRREFASGK